MHQSIVFALSLTLSLVAVGCVADEPELTPAPIEVERAPVTLESSSVAKETPPGEIDPLARDFCCVVKMDPPVICHQGHTAAVWAGPKCVAAGVGLNRRGSTLYGGSCGDHPECF